MVAGFLLSRQNLRGKHQFALLSLVALVAVPISIALAKDYHSSRSELIETPERWVGKPFPMRREIDIGDELESGKWRVLLYRADCAACQNALSALRIYARETNDQCAAVEITVDGQSSKVEDVAIVSGRVKSSFEADIPTPMVVELDDGIVVKSEYVGEHS